MDTKALREEFATLHTDAGKVLTAAATEKRELTAEEKEANDKRFARMDTIKAQVDAAKRLAEFAVINGEAEFSTTPKGKEEFESERTGTIPFDAIHYRAAVNLYCRTGDLSKVQQFATTSGTASGAYLPKEVVQPAVVRRLPNAIRQLINFYGYQPITRTFTESISLPIVDDTGVTGQSQSEGATSGTTADPDSSGSMTLLPNLYSSKQIWLSNTVVNAPDFDAFSYAIPLLQRRLDKVQEQAWVGQLKSAGTVGVTVAPSGGSYSQWLAFEHALPASYRTDAGFIVSDSAYRVLRGLTDSNGRPIMDLDPTNQFQATVHGKPVIPSDYLDALASAKVVGVFASADALKVFDAGPLRIVRYVNDPNHPDQTGLEIFRNGDFGFLAAGVRTMATS